MNKAALNLFNIRPKCSQRRPDLFKFSGPPFMCAFYHPQPDKYTQELMIDFYNFVIS
jgi:hypothetical protein